MPYNNEEIAEIAREAAEDIRILLGISAMHDTCKQETIGFNSLFEKNLAKLDKLGEF